MRRSPHPSRSPKELQRFNYEEKIKTEVDISFRSKNPKNLTSRDMNLLLDNVNYGNCHRSGQWVEP